ncbi:mannonate dehydratase [Paramicrobacterium chengjingii]|uniref:mannonate dehydratase n=1 Tax=Paramicrobacterium chengjingii TaxID=2769067 RepID=UPI001420CCCE|nr:mannonate dehydratase [Microbacterium chengjingii]
MIEIAEIVTSADPKDFWRNLRQMNITKVVSSLPRGSLDWRSLSPTDDPWSYTALAIHQEKLAEWGFETSVIEDSPPLDPIRFGLSGREEAVTHVIEMIKAMGRLGIPTWCYNWNGATEWLRTQQAVVGRGGALVAGYRHSTLDHNDLTKYGHVEPETLWANLSWFMERVLPVAENAGVRLAMHPDDPPVPEVRGISRIMNSLEGYDRLFEEFPSSANAMTLCQGNFTLMTDDLPAAIRKYGNEDRIAFVHFRDVAGTPEHFVETFHDEGKTDMLACMRAYDEIGYSGVMRSDHVPLMSGDTQDVPGYGRISRHFAIGYMTALREAATSSGGLQ